MRTVWNEEYGFVEGVELSGMSDALLLAKQLGAMAAEEIENLRKPPVEDEGIDMSTSYIACAGEALTLQAQVLKAIEYTGDEPFSFRAVDEEAGSTLSSAAHPYNVKHPRYDPTIRPSGRWMTVEEKLATARQAAERMGKSEAWTAARLEQIKRSNKLVI